MLPFLICAGKNLRGVLGGIPVVPPKLSEERNALFLKLNSVEVDLDMVVP
jgi:hypothetical protein